MFVKIIDRKKFKEQFKLWHDRKVTVSEGMKACKIKSRATWYRIAKEEGLI